MIGGSTPRETKIIFKKSVCTYHVDVCSFLERLHKLLDLITSYSDPIKGRLWRPNPPKLKGLIDHPGG